MPDNDNDRSPFGRRPNADPGGGSGAPKPRFAPWLVVPIILVALLLFNSVLSRTNTNKISFSEFQTAVADGKIVSDNDNPVRISDNQVSGQISTDEGTKDFTTPLSPNVLVTPGGDFTNSLEEAGIVYTFEQPSVLLSVILNFLPFLLIMFAVYWFVFRRMGSGATGALNMGKNKVKIYDRKELKTTFADVAGVDEAKEELREIVEFLSNPKKYQRLGGRIPKGVLLLGPPGCGKTLLARAVAGEANVPFFFMSGSEFVEMFVGLGAARVRELFQQAKEKAPALVFLDEIDTIGKGRAGAGGAGPGRARRARADPEPAAGRDGRVRRQQGRHHHGRHEPSRRARPRTGPARDASTGRWSWTAPTSRVARRSCACTPAAWPCPPTSSCARSPLAPPASPAPTWRTW